ncbi:hypothetical protein [Phenylobacterium sp.]|jgi:hypothetical protein|uniref:hypothetical protein n=1 Tax=Phenylobacterium sp. TaxID=1871053 RepID=UPI002C5775D1|nr:hypothetical protein [Phenylobacterium sp.]
MRAQNLSRPEIRLIGGFTALVAAALSAEYAWLHAQSTAALYGAICGEGPLVHCAACYAAPAFAFVGAWLLAPQVSRLIERLSGRS